ncbi:uncharacterized protein ASCRUDRAFT_74929 [Ascoidea rubescens DSM 1968]|uniref:CBM1 domain-containing protein n=1 Tax=Ascoidea rubescens DSM 1968 TaxID=1344418 RepID=A0A1D2VLT9_9ASCO|nr:hypothetical protein ASCRUDRAFT_74929 [Ascoidea rubescens DSM 1968]ODV62573.1 hypothetical protein ASCRUDRAFT_74929 [Ascoidea rubescens DSM 1968]
MLFAKSLFLSSLLSLTSLATCQSNSTTDSTCVPLYYQCGGINWTGSTCCSSGSCIEQNEYYWQCVDVSDESEASAEINYATYNYNASLILEPTISTNYSDISATGYSIFTNNTVLAYSNISNTSYVVNYDNDDDDSSEEVTVYTKVYVTITTDLSTETNDGLITVSTITITDFVTVDDPVSSDLSTTLKTQYINGTYTY